MHEFKVVREEFRETTDAAGNPVMLPWYTFHVSEDGKTWFPSMKWFRECAVEGLPKTYYVDRCINRLKAGRSAEAFGQSAVVLADGKPVGFAAVEKGRGRAEVYQGDDAPKVEMVKLKGGIEKPRESRKGFKVKVDGACLGKEYPTEAAAKAAAAIHCFMTRNKLGRIPHALAQLQEQFPGRACKVWACCKANGIRATVDGKEYSIGWVRDASGQWRVEKFKALEPTE